MKKPIIQFENFSFQYQAQTEPTLKNVDLTIYEGEKVLVSLRLAAAFMTCPILSVPSCKTQTVNLSG